MTGAERIAKYRATHPKPETKIQALQRQLAEAQARIAELVRERNRYKRTAKKQGTESYG
jgi:hypothetical protein